jgi:3',5'-cyclic AMP phosphodiesterase CpdA
MTGPAPRHRLALAQVAALAAACFEFSPHELPTDSRDEDVHERSLEALARSPPRDPLRFAVIGDMQRAFDAAEDFVAAVNGRRDELAFVVQAGDFTQLGLTFEFEAMNAIFRDLHVPYFVVVGNHDLIGNGRAVYEHMFGPLDFAFTYARLRVVLLNTNSREFAFAPNVPDLEWLAAQLAPDGEHDRAVVICHVAPDGGDFNEALAQPYRAVLREAGVRLSINAHGHLFQLRNEGDLTLATADSAEHRSYLLVTALQGGGFDVEKVPF